jgi:septum formation topological specificity factor MinE
MVTPDSTVNPCGAVRLYLKRVFSVRQHAITGGIVMDAKQKAEKYRNMAALADLEGDILEVVKKFDSRDCKNVGCDVCPLGGICIQIDALSVEVARRAKREAE